MVVSSAKLQTSLSSMKKIVLFIKMLKRIGPKIEPCGRPLKFSRYELNLTLFLPADVF